MEELLKEVALTSYFLHRIVGAMLTALNEISKQQFINPTRGVMSFSELVDCVLRESSQRYHQPLRISVGTDSEVLGSVIKYVSLVHVWRVGRGACAYRTESYEPSHDALRAEARGMRMRIWREVLLTAMLAQELRSALREKFVLPLCDEIEVHADVGEQGRSSVMIREVIGMLKGYGFPDAFIKLKPESFAASSVADHYI